MANIKDMINDLANMVGTFVTDAADLKQRASRLEQSAEAIGEMCAAIRAAGPLASEPEDLASLLRKAAELAEQSASPPLLPSGLTIGQTAATGPAEHGAGDSAAKKQKPQSGSENEDPNPKKAASRSYSKTGGPKPKPQTGRKEQAAGSDTTDSEAEDADSRFDRVALGSGKRSPSLELDLKKPAAKSETKKRPVATEVPKKKAKITAADWDF